MSKQTVTRKEGSVHINIEVMLFKEHDTFVAYCPALELSSYGVNQADAKKAFEGALSIFIKETSKRGTLEKFLLKLGWSLEQKPKVNYRPPVLNLKDQQNLLLKNPSIYQERISMPL
jgi:hypothetical protein